MRDVALELAEECIEFGPERGPDRDRRLIDDRRSGRAKQRDRRVDDRIDLRADRGIVGAIPPDADSGANKRIRVEELRVVRRSVPDLRPRASARPIARHKTTPARCVPTTGSCRRWVATLPAKLIKEGYATLGSGRSYDISRDGQRFLMIKPSPGSDQATAPTGIIVVQNWGEELKRLVQMR